MGANGERRTADGGRTVPVVSAQGDEIEPVARGAPRDRARRASVHDIHLVRDRDHHAPARRELLFQVGRHPTTVGRHQDAVVGRFVRPTGDSWPGQLEPDPAQAPPEVPPAHLDQVGDDIDLEDDRQTNLGVVVDTVLSGTTFSSHLTWAFGVYDLFGWQRALPVGSLAPARTFTQPGRSLFAEVRFAY